MNSIHEETEKKRNWKKPEQEQIIESVPAPPPGKREYKKQIKKIVYNKWWKINYIPYIPTPKLGIRRKKLLLNELKNR